MGHLELEQLAVMGAANVGFEALRLCEEADKAPNIVEIRVTLDDARALAQRSASLGLQAPMRTFELDGFGNQILRIVADKYAKLLGGPEKTEPLGELFTPPNPPTLSLSDLAK